MRILTIISLAGVMMTTAGIAQPTNNWQQEFMKAKYGRTFANAATKHPANNPRAIRTALTELQLSSRNQPRVPVPWRDQWLMEKYGRYSHPFEALQDERHIMIAATGESATTDYSFASKANAWRDELLKAKYGR